MDSSKLEPRLAAEIQRIESSPTPEAGIPVLLELAGEPASGAGFGELRERVSRTQAPLLEWLSESGIAAEASTLANTISATLTARQIESAAARAQVKRVIWNRADRVTALA